MPQRGQVATNHQGYQEANGRLAIVAIRAVVVMLLAIRLDRKADDQDDRGGKRERDHSLQQPLPVFPVMRPLIRF
jgi:hypothetical protein